MRRLRYVLIGVACVGISLGVVLAQQDALSGGTLRGQITDLTPAQNPIEGVEVKIVAQDSGQEFITKTEADGNYKHAGLPAGRYLIRISKDGYNERTGKPVTIVDGGEHFIPLKMTRKGAIEPFFKVRRDERMNVVIKQRIVSLIQRVAKGVGKRYTLDETVINAFHQSVLNAIGSVLEQDGGLSVFARAVEEGNMSLLEMLLAHPGCKAAFAKHLSKVQLQDYLEFTEAREIRDRQAVVQWIAATLDKELSLKAHQREHIVESLLNAADNDLFPNAMNALWLSPEQAAQLVHYRLKVSLNGVLSEAQSKVWQGLVSAKTNEVDMFIIAPEVGIKRIIKVDGIDAKDVAGPNKRFVFIPNEPDEHIGIEEEVEVVIEDIAIDPQGMQPWIEINPINTDTAKTPEQMMEITEAKLAAHTELLGALDERAARRLALVTKGVAQEYIEARDRDREAMGKLRRDGGSKTAITSHPMYQQAIKDVLSEEAFAAYSKHQAERETLSQQALRGMVVAGMDMQLLLDETQRERLETAVSQLIPGPLNEGSSLISMFFQLFPQTVDFEVLTPWQRGEFERVFGPIARRR